MGMVLIMPIRIPIIKPIIVPVKEIIRVFLAPIKNRGQLFSNIKYTQVKNVLSADIVVYTPVA
jgi:hypothetical protein